MSWPEKKTPMWDGFTYFVNHKEMRLVDLRDYSRNRERYTATDQATGRHYRIRRASCGLGCRCAAAIVKEIQ
jgi:hypothetical protein